MDSFQITGEDASRIALALIADKFQGQSKFPVETLQSHWTGLGLRLDDLVQGLTLLTRDHQLSIEGNADGAELTLSESTMGDLADTAQGLQHLDAPLQEILKMAAERKSAKQKPDQERRDGFT